MYSILAPAWLLRTDSFVAALILPLAILILISGLDDLVVDAVWLWGWAKAKSRNIATIEPASTPEKRIAIFVPLWKEHAVIASMLEHNIAAIHYDNYDFFVGVYPNDERTMDVVRDVEERFPRVHLAICPHDGPTSKADCLNWVYQRMLLHEEQYNIRHDIVVTHDAEDLIHPD